MSYFGSSTGETGEYGVGDLVKGHNWKKTPDGYEIDDEPVYNVWVIKDNDLEYID